MGMADSAEDGTLKDVRGVPAAAAAAAIACSAFALAELARRMRELLRDGPGVEWCDEWWDELDGVEGAAEPQLLAAAAASASAACTLATAAAGL